MINPHIPQYISQAPWYLQHSSAAQPGTDVQVAPGLKHQYQRHFAKQAHTTKHAPLDQHTKRIKVVPQPASSASSGGGARSSSNAFMPGACENCGSTSHKRRDCLERPRARNAALLNQRLVPHDDVLLQPSTTVDYESKRDRWAGTRVEHEHRRTVERYERQEAERRKRKLLEIEQALEAASRAKLEQNSNQSNRDADDEKSNTTTTTMKSDNLTVQQQAKNDARAERKLRKLRAKLASQVNGTAATTTATSSSKDARASDSSSSSSDEDDELKDTTGTLLGQHQDEKTAITVRNLRIREDTAKYLRNLNPHSAHYDPKTRSMRENPYEGTGKQALYRGDNFIRGSGEVAEVQRMQRLVWDANRKSSTVVTAAAAASDNNNDATNASVVSLAQIDSTALPSAAEQLFRKHEQQAQQRQSEQQRAILAKYASTGATLDDSASNNNSAALQASVGDASLSGDQLSLLLHGSSEAYAEYDEEGRLAGASQLRAAPVSSYSEDQFENGHTAIWGSYYDLKRHAWGYKCCESTLRHCVCTGEQGKLAKRQLEQQMRDRLKQPATSELAQQVKIESPSKAAATKPHSPSLSGHRAKRSRDQESALNLSAAHPIASSCSTKTGALSHLAFPSEREQEDYHAKRRRADDPMLSFKADG